MPSSVRDAAAQPLLIVMLALTVALLGGAGSGLYEHTRPAVYLSSATLLIDQPALISSQNNDGPLAKLQRLRYQYADLLNTDVIGEPVARQLDLPQPVVESALRGVVPPASFTLTVLAHTKDASKAPLLAQAGANALSSYVSKNQAENNVAPLDRIQLTEVLSATPGIKVAPSKKRQLVAAAVGFVMVGVAFLIGVDVFRRRSR